MPSWPSSLDTRAAAGTHRISNAQNVISFKPDVGEPIRRRRYTGRSSQESFEQTLSAAQLDVLQDFWAVECQQGALSFTAPLIDDVLRKWWFDPERPFEAVNIRGGTYYRVSYNMGCVR